MNIRLAISADLGALEGLLSACVQDLGMQGIDQWDDVYPTATIHAQDLRARTLYVLQRDETLLGCLTLDETFDPLWQGLAWQAPDDAALAVHRLMIDPGHQGQGLGRRLMSFAELRTLELDKSALRLDAFLHNPAALRLYDGLGYRRAGMAQMRKGPFVGFEKNLL
jgi:GNAT superfamily N-acetyltransferase